MKPGQAQQSRDERREAILKIASDVFREAGYASASMSMIAARLGGSKGTLYNYFKSKEALFEAHIQTQCTWASDILVEVNGDDSDIAATLRSVGQRYLQNVMADSLVDNFRLLIAESQRTPELGRAFYESGPAVGLRRLAELLASAAAGGRLKPLDSQLAARQFLDLCRGPLWMERMLNLAPAPSAEQAARHAATAVEMFMACYGPV